MSEPTEGTPAGEPVRVKVRPVAPAGVGGTFRSAAFRLPTASRNVETAIQLAIVAVALYVAVRHGLCAGLGTYLGLGLLRVIVGLALIAIAVRRVFRSQSNMK